MTAPPSPHPRPADPFACPDPIAERRYAYALSAAREGDFATAAEVLAQALERAPDWAPALFALGEAREKLGDPLGAAEAFRACLTADPSDRHGSAPRISLIGADAPPAALPAAYVARLFDDYAPRFDRHLRQDLLYRGPELVAEALETVAPDRAFGLAYDLGCGTGLAAPTLRSRAARLIGVDLSPAMVAAARAGGRYDRLEVGDVVAFLEGAPARAADLAVAADVLVYLGDLAPFCGGLTQALAPGGVAVFTVEENDAPGYRLQPSIRYAHARDYVETTLQGAGLRLTLCRSAVLRQEAGRDRPGLVFAAER